MNESKIYESDRIRIWSGAFPDVGYNPLEVARRSWRPVDLKINCPNYAQSVAIEIYLIHGPKCSHGILGAELIGGLSDEFIVDVPVTKENGERLEWSRMGRMDETYGGLPEEYTSSVFQGVDRYLNSHTIAGGSLRFKCAAHSVMSSSPNVFKNLSTAVLEILCGMPMDTPEMVGIVEKWCLRKKGV